MKLHPQAIEFIRYHGMDDCSRRTEDFDSVNIKTEGGDKTIFEVKDLWRFMDKVEKTNNCWEWKGVKSRGYGYFRFKDRMIGAHRFSYELFKGLIPKELQIDHLCRNRKCVNPDHLEAVTPKENLYRGNPVFLLNKSKTRCKNGHELTIDSVWISKNGGRYCKTCHNKRQKEYSKKKLLSHSNRINTVTKGGEEYTTQRSIADFKQEGDSVSLAKLKGASFTIVAVEESDYEDNGKINPGVKILTQESYNIDGKKYRKFHTTRTAIVNKLKNPQVRAALTQGDTIGPVKTMEVPAKKGGKPYYDLVPAAAGTVV